MSAVGIPVLAGWSGRTGDRDEAGLGLDQHVVGLALLELAADPESGYPDRDEFGPLRPQFVCAQTQTVRRPGCEVLEEDVGTVDQTPHDRNSLRGLEVDRDRLLAAVEPDEMRSGAVHDVVVAAGEVAAVDAFHLDHPRAEVGEVAGGQRCGNGLLDGDYGESLERQAHVDFLLAWRTNPPPMMSRWISLVPS